MIPMTSGNRQITEAVGLMITVENRLTTLVLANLEIWCVVSRLDEIALVVDLEQPRGFIAHPADLYFPAHERSFLKGEGANCIARNVNATGLVARRNHPLRPLIVRPSSGIRRGASSPRPAAISSSLSPIFSFRVWGHFRGKRGAETLNPTAPLCYG